MQALLLRQAGPLGPESLILQERPGPAPGPGQVRLRVRACGVCRTDLHIAEGELPAPELPLILGHQAIGTVDALGPGCSLLNLGERVGVPWLWSACGRCGHCRQGRENLCDQARFTGLHVPGGFADRLVAPEAFAHRIPEGLADAAAAPLLCAGAIGWRALKLAEIERGRLGLFGFGSSAHLVLQLAKARGLEVCAFSRGESHRALALRLGAAYALDPGERPPQPLDAAILFAPSGEAVPLALKALGKGGRLVLAGVTMSDLPELPYELLSQERSIRSVANVTQRDVQKVLRAAEKGGLAPETTSFPFQDAGKVLGLMKDGRLNGSAVLTF